MSSVSILFDVFFSKAKSACMHTGHLDRFLHTETDTVSCSDIPVAAIMANTVSNVQSAAPDVMWMVQTFDTRIETPLPHHEVVLSPEQLALESIADKTSSIVRNSVFSPFYSAPIYDAKPEKPRRSHKVRKVRVATVMKSSRRG